METQLKRLKDKKKDYKSTKKILNDYLLVQVIDLKQEIRTVSDKLIKAETDLSDLRFEYGSWKEQYEVEKKLWKDDQERIRIMSSRIINHDTVEFLEQERNLSQIRQEAYSNQDIVNELETKNVHLEELAFNYHEIQQQLHELQLQNGRLASQLKGKEEENLHLHEQISLKKDRLPFGNHDYYHTQQQNQHQYAYQQSPNHYPSQYAYKQQSPSNKYNYPPAPPQQSQTYYQRYIHQKLRSLEKKE